MGMLTRKPQNLATVYSSGASAPDRPLIPMSSLNTDIIHQFGLEALCDLLAQAKTQTEIAGVIGVPQPQLSIWINNRRGEAAELIAEAKKAGAEAYLDRGLQELVDVRGTENNAAVSLARALDAHHARRAGLFNRQFHDKYQPPEQQAAPIAPPAFTIQIISQENQTVTINQNPEPNDEVTDLSLI